MSKNLLDTGNIFTFEISKSILPIEIFFKILS